MHVTLFGVVLFLHIAVAIVAFAMAGVLHTALNVIARGRTVQELRSWASVVHRIEPLLPLMALALLGLGAWLVHLGAHTDDAFSFSDGWIITAIVTLVLVEAIGGIVLAPRGRRLVELISTAADGPVTHDIRTAAFSRPFWHLAHVTTFGFLGVVFLMAAKPAGAWAWIYPVAGAVLGVALSHAQLGAAARSLGAAEIPGQRTTAETASEVKAS